MVDMFNRCFLFIYNYGGGKVWMKVVMETISN
jgi:hypothetical protein